MYASYCLGAIVGSIWNGIKCDQTGRKRVFASNTIVHILGCILQVIDQYYVLYAFARFLMGFSAMGLVISAYLIMFEFSNLQSRLLATCIFRSLESIGILLFRAVAAAHAGTRERDGALLALNFGLIFGLLFLPESLRWLKVQNRQEIRNQTMDYVQSKFGFVTKCEVYVLAQKPFKMSICHYCDFISKHFYGFLCFSWMLTVVSPNNIWRFEQIIVKETQISILTWLYFEPLIILFSCILGLYFLIAFDREYAYFLLLILALFNCVPAILVKRWNIEPYALMLSIPFLNAVFFVVVLMIAEQTPTTIRGGMIGIYNAIQISIFLFFDNALYKHIPTVSFHLVLSAYAASLAMAGLLLTCSCKGTCKIGYIDSWLSSVEFSKLYPGNYMY